MFRHTLGGLVTRGSTHASPANNKRIQIFSFSKENEFPSVDSDGNCTPTSGVLYHLTENFGNSGWKVNGKVTFRKFQPKIEEYVLM